MAGPLLPAALALAAASASQVAAHGFASSSAHPFFSMPETRHMHPGVPQHAHAARSFGGGHDHGHHHGKRQTKTTCPNLPNPDGFDTSLTKNFPKIGAIASLVKGDDVAEGVYKSILANKEYATVLAYTPQGGNMGDFTNVTYDYGKDDHCWWTGTTCHQPKVSYLPTDTFTCDEPETWGLTFDDGPFCDNADFYDFLSQHSLKASLFYIGANVLTWPAQAQRGLEDGHEICVHTWSHHYMTTLSNEQAFAELYYTKKAIKDVMGVTPTCWRPPFGDTDDRIRTIAFALGMRTVIWNHDTFDWSVYDGSTVEDIEQNYKYIYGNVSDSSGVIVLSHELNADTISMFESQYPTLAKTYKNVVPVASCMNVTQPYMESTVSFPNFEQFVGGNVNATAVTPKVSDAEVSIVEADKIDQTGGAGVQATATGASKDPSATKSGSSSSDSGSSDDTSGAERMAASMLLVVAGAMGMLA